MKVKTLDINESQELMSEWVSSGGKTLPYVDKEYNSIRGELNRVYIEAMHSNDEIGSRRDYYKDVVFGIKLYKYLIRQKWFNLRIASDVGFWRYLSIVVIPDIVAQRWSFDNEDHYWRKPTRIWLRSIWWYIHLSWQDGSNATKEMLLSPMFNTDTILNLVERSGRDGMNIDVYKMIMKKYSLQEQNTLQKFKEGSKKRDDLFRAVMRLNTARIMVYEPSFCEGGVEGYVTSLFDAFTDEYNSIKPMVYFKQ